MHVVGQKDKPSPLTCTSLHEKPGKRNLNKQSIPHWRTTNRKKGKEGSSFTRQNHFYLLCAGNEMCINLTPLALQGPVRTSSSLTAGPKGPEQESLNQFVSITVTGAVRLAATPPGPTNTRSAPYVFIPLQIRLLNLHVQKQRCGCNTNNLQSKFCFRSGNTDSATQESVSEIKNKDHQYDSRFG